MSTLAPPDIEGAAIAYLEPVLGVKVATRMPKSRPTSMVRVGVIGGAEASASDANPTLLVECWAASSTAAYALARKAWAALKSRHHEYMGGVWVVSVAPQHPVNFPDPDTTSPRYQFLASFRVAMTDEPL